MLNREPKQPLPAKAQQRPLPANAELTEDELSEIGGGGASAGKIVINRRRWGDIENRVSYADLVRW
jgi:hypothetical protein